VLVSGPVALPPLAGVELVRVETARDMAAAVEAALPCDVFIAAAAVADWRVDSDFDQKIKKNGDSPPALKLVENPDILATVARRSKNRPSLVVGFAPKPKNFLSTRAKNWRAKLRHDCRQ